MSEQLLVGHRRELGAGDGTPLDAELAGDRGGGRGVVAGDHAHPDPGRAAERDRVLGLLARRIDDADQRQQLEVLEDVEQHGLAIERRRVEVLASNRQHAQTLAGQTVVLGEHPIPLPVQ